MSEIISRKRICCNCGHNIRTQENTGHIRCNCDVDGHYIGYAECFSGWCPKWKRDRKWDKLKGENENGGL